MPVIASIAPRWGRKFGRDTDSVREETAGMATPGNERAPAQIASFMRTRSASERASIFSMTRER